MIISKTPYRVSLFGGGTDHYDYFSKYNGITVGGSINKYIYISLRKLPVFFKHRFRISWSKIENVKKIENITHPIVRELLNHFKIKEGLEIHYDGDLPGNSGTGSSAAFCVGLIKCLARYTKKNLTRKEIALLAYKIEKVNLKESTGIQDQIYATYGGFSKITYTKKEFKISKITKDKKIQKRIENNLILFYTYKSRVAHNIEKKKFSNIKNKLKNLDKMKLMAHQSIKHIKNNDIDKIGLMLDRFWQYKKKLSNNVTNEKIDQYYSIAIKNGALGGKLIGAGGGGFLLIYAKKKYHKKIIKSLNKLTPIKFNFTSKGSRIIENEI
tara:strand:+ start:137 stop:1114 length:978 start_codon:yes stop_codon:yes gene_type:complete